MAVTEFQRYQSSLTNALFVETADHNYLVARWAFLHRLYRDFYWNSLHLLEKYLKASLLLNGHSALPYGHHDIVEMYERVAGFAGEFLPSVLVRPNEIYFGTNWTAEPVESFLAKIHARGNADNRYAYFSYVQEPDDLFKIDALVFTLRRVTVGLDWEIGPNDLTQYRTYRDWLRASDDFQPRGAVPNLPKIRDEEFNESLLTALHRLNFAFRRDEADLQGKWQGRFAKNSWLYLLTERGLDPNDVKKDEVAASTIHWLVENVRFARPLRSHLLEIAGRLQP